MSAKAFAHGGKALIEDELLQSNYFKKHHEMPHQKEKVSISDELLNPDYTNSTFKLGVYTNQYANQPIEDELLKDDNFIIEAGKYVLSERAVPDDYFFEKNIDLTKVRKIHHKNKYDFTKKQVAIQIKIAQHLKSTVNISEGATIPFIAQHDFEIKGKKYDRGTTILGRVETISASDKMGTPESIKISNFYVPDEEEIELHGSVSKTGANRAIWVYPLYQAGNIALYVAGFVFVPIHGGRAKLSTTEAFTVYFEAQ